MNNIITRLYPYGKDYLDITSVNDGKAYIDSPLIGEYENIYEGYIDFLDIDNPAELLKEAEKQWSTT